MDSTISEAEIVANLAHRNLGDDDRVLRRDRSDRSAAQNPIIQPTDEASAEPHLNTIQSRSTAEDLQQSTIDLESDKGPKPLPSDQVPADFRRSAANQPEKPLAAATEKSKPATNATMGITSNPSESTHMRGPGGPRPAEMPAQRGNNQQLAEAQQMHGNIPMMTGSPDRWQNVANQLAMQEQELFDIAEDRLLQLAAAITWPEDEQSMARAAAIYMRDWEAALRTIPNAPGAAEIISRVIIDGTHPNLHGPVKETLAQLIAEADMSDDDWKSAMPATTLRLVGAAISRQQCKTISSSSDCSAMRTARPEMHSAARCSNKSNN